MQVYKDMLDRDAQLALVEDVRTIAKQAPFVTPVTPSGKAMSVKMTSAGRFGWVTDGQGYRYAQSHPNGTPWPVIPPSVLGIWTTVAGVDRPPECCLVNYYGTDAKMGMHQDRDEANFEMPVVSVSLGDDALFRVGHETRGGKTESVWLQSGDVVVMGGQARLLYHGIDRLKPNSSTLLAKGGRINLTLRVVT
ncbi:alpha-ketoglutarate-dependent dioxygenase AlkB [Nereida sp. MMG025]|uniref:alpha-ketoglutarate-dependent dioxygenase AlkB family protein n=1 Tax=Nereida sp. MMG025 TaxID=2909981 RepID=UPI001F3FEA81|nr:alpha-ketoglutarate-dependent dioxygenase AlkB [Nereida sp. MMG025]MCF6444562.1 alpha-ketoglutarate-dependent dioxygenase AlkB [Nereida sp. MMG025]